MTPNRTFVLLFVPTFILGAGIMAAAHGQLCLALPFVCLAIVAFFVLRAVLPRDDGPSL